MALIMEVVPLGRLKEVVQGALTSPHARQWHTRGKGGWEVFRAGANKRRRLPLARRPLPQKWDGSYCNKETCSKPTQ